MTNEELAKHWGVSLKEVERISKIMNDNYHHALVQDPQTKEWRGVLFGFHIAPSGWKSVRALQYSSKSFKKINEAAKYWNTLSDNLQIPWTNPLSSEVPPDAFKAVKKLEIPSIIPHRQHEPRVFPIHTRE